MNINTDLFILLLWLYLVINSICGIYCGAVGKEKSTHYDTFDSFWHLIILFILIIVVIK